MLYTCICILLQKKLEAEEAADLSPDDDYVPYVPLKQKRRMEVSTHSHIF